MAEGRMIVTKIGRDPRIASLSRTARMIWAFILPHTDSKGTVPRDADELRLTCFPAWNDVTNNEVESSILEFFVPKPAIAIETIIRGEKRIQLCEFEMCNWNLEFMKKKRWREEKANVRDCRGLSGTVVDCPSRSEVKGREEKRREVDKNNKQQIVVNDTVTITVPTLGQVVEACQELKAGIDPKDWHDYWTARGWKDKNGLICWKEKLNLRAYFIGKERQSGAPPWRCEKCMVYHVKAIPCPPGAPRREESPCRK